MVEVQLVRAFITHVSVLYMGPMLFLREGFQLSMVDSGIYLRGPQQGICGLLMASGVKGGKSDSPPFFISSCSVHKTCPWKAKYICGVVEMAALWLKLSQFYERSEKNPVGSMVWSRHSETLGIHYIHEERLKRDSGTEHDSTWDLMVRTLAQPCSSKVML